MQQRLPWPYPHRAVLLGDFRLWLKADAGVTGTTPISAWADQSSMPLQQHQPAIAWLIGDTNQYNPAIDFTRSNTEFLQITNGITALAQYNDMWTFVVSQTDLTATTNTLTYETTAGSGTYSILLPWSDANTLFRLRGLGNRSIERQLGRNIWTTNLWTFGSSTSTATPNGAQNHCAMAQLFFPTTTMMALWGVIKLPDWWGYNIGSADRQTLLMEELPS